jgi:hypothetical protein
MDCNVKSKWFKLFAPWAHKPILKAHGLVQTYTIAFGSWNAHKLCRRSRPFFNALICDLCGLSILREKMGPSLLLGSVFDIFFFPPPGPNVAKVSFIPKNMATHNSQFGTQGSYHGTHQIAYNFINLPTKDKGVWVHQDDSYYLDLRCKSY